MKKIYKCIDCFKPLTRTNPVKRCRKCYRKFAKIPENNPNYIDGRSFKIYYCKDCETKITRRTAIYLKGRCPHCSKLGKRSSSYINGLSKNITKYMKFKRKNDINFRVKDLLRSRIYNALKHNKKSKHTIELIGCSINFLRNYIEKQFSKGMTWKNWGRHRKGEFKKFWQLDHIRPCSSFDLSKPEEQLKCFNYTNLQPLWSEDNIKKHCKVDKGDK